MSVLVTKKLSGGVAGSSVFSQSEKLALELEMSFKAANLTNYKELSYDSDDNLELITIYENDTKVVSLFTKEFFYDSAGILMAILITRNSDAASILKSLTYNINDILESIEVS